MFLFIFSLNEICLALEQGELKSGGFDVKETITCKGMINIHYLTKLCLCLV